MSVAKDPPVNYRRPAPESEPERREIIRSPQLHSTLEGLAEGYRFLRLHGVTAGWEVRCQHDEFGWLRMEAIKYTVLDAQPGALKNGKGEDVGLQTDITDFDVKRKEKKV